MNFTFDIIKGNNMGTHNDEFIGLDIPPAPRQLFLKDAMPFGKYAGRNIEELCSEDPRYMEWFRDNIDRVILSLEVRHEIEDVLDEQSDPNDFGFNRDDIPW